MAGSEQSHLPLLQASDQSDQAPTGAMAGSDQTESDGKEPAPALTPSSKQLDLTSAEALVKISKINKRKRPLPEADIEDLWTWVVFECALCLLLALFPLFGLIPCFYMLAAYNWRRRHLAHKSIQRLVNFFSVVSLIIAQCIDVYNYIQLYMKGLPGRRFAQFMLVNVISTVISVAGIVVGQMLTARSTEARADVAFYKARSIEKLKGVESLVFWTKRSLRSWTNDKDNAEAIDRGKFQQINEKCINDCNKEDFPVAVPMKQSRRGADQDRSLTMLKVYTKYFDWLFEGLQTNRPPPNNICPDWLDSFTGFSQFMNKDLGQCSDKIFVVVGTLSMFVGMGLSLVSLAKEHPLRQAESPSWLELLWVLFQVILVTRGWFKLLVTLQSSAVQVRKNSRQLLLFASFVKQDFRVWTTESKQNLAEIWTKMIDHLQDAKKKDILIETMKKMSTLNLEAPRSLLVHHWCAAGAQEDSDEEHDEPRGTIDVSSLNLEVEKFVSEKFVHEAPIESVIQVMNDCITEWENPGHDCWKGTPQSPLKLDLRNHDDIRVWWTLREFLQVDFMDESAIMDYCSSCTLLLVLAFSVVVLACFFMNKDHGFSDMKGIGVVINCFGQILVLTHTFYIMMEACILMNSTLEQDSSILLDTAVKVRLRIDGDGEGTDADTKAKATANLLTSLHEKVVRYDNPQKLFGYAVTKNLRNGLYTSLSLLAVNYAWSLVGPVLLELDPEEVAHKVGVNWEDQGTLPQ